MRGTVKALRAEVGRLEGELARLRAVAEAARNLSYCYHRSTNCYSELVALDLALDRLDGEPEGGRSPSPTARIAELEAQVRALTRALGREEAELEALRAKAGWLTGNSVPRYVRVSKRGAMTEAAARMVRSELKRASAEPAALEMDE